MNQASNKYSEQHLREVVALLREYENNRTRTAYRLGITLPALRHRLRRAEALGMEVPASSGLGGVKGVQTPTSYTPTPDEIAEHCQAFRESWTPEQEWAHRVVKSSHYEIPHSSRSTGGRRIKPARRG